MAQHCKGPKLCHILIYPSCYQQGCSTGVMHGACCWGRTALGQLWEFRWGQSWCQQLFALLTVPMPHACRMGLPPDGKAKAQSQQSEAAMSDGVPVSEEVGFGRESHSKGILHYSNKTKIFQPITHAGQGTSLTPGNMSCFSSCFPKNSALEMRDAEPESFMLLSCKTQNQQ